jgi:hypothetical protein
MQTVHDALYLDGRPPEGWSERMDWGIASRLVKKYGEAEVLSAIQGLALLRDSGKLSWAPPGTKMTLKALSTAKMGEYAVFHRARVACWKQEQPTMQQLGAVLREAMQA